MEYSNITLSSEDLSVVVYLPANLRSDPNQDVFYRGSRFDHSSMIGSVIRTDAEGYEHVLYGTSMWRVPHNEHWPESGVGLAAEFGVGDSGAFCFFHCGWQQASDVTNGVLGYTEARIGEPFLKVGVGALVKGTCPECDSTGDYKFNSPYLFHEEPKWTLDRSSDRTIVMEHEARLNQYGYKIVKEIALVGDTLTVTNSLTNLGRDSFSTVWYSHHFFTCDRNAVGPGYAIELDLAGENREPIYEEPGTWSWATPLSRYANVFKKTNSIRVEMERALPPGVRIKSEFLNDGRTTGSFRVEACQSTIESTLPNLESSQMYAYNLYIERGTFSPEPQFLLNLAPGETKTWTQQLQFGELDPASESYFMASLSGMFTRLISPHSVQGYTCLVIAGFFLALVAVQRSWISGRRSSYQSL